VLKESRYWLAVLYDKKELNVGKKAANKYINFYLLLLRDWLWRAYS